VWKAAVEVVDKDHHRPTELFEYFPKLATKRSDLLRWRSRLLRLDQLRPALRRLLCDLLKLVSIVATARARHKRRDGRASLRQQTGRNAERHADTEFGGHPDCAEVVYAGREKLDLLDQSFVALGSLEE